MSFQVIERSFAHTRQRGSFLAALFFLADRADDHGVSWYGVPKIAQNINLSERQTRHILHTLRECGEIWCTPRFLADGSQTSNGYLVCCGLDLETIRTALHHPELQLSDEGIEAAVREIAARRGEPLVKDKECAPGDDRTQADDVDLAPTKGFGVAPAGSANRGQADDVNAWPTSGAGSGPMRASAVAPTQDCLVRDNPAPLGNDLQRAAADATGEAPVSAAAAAAGNSLSDILRSGEAPDARPPPGETPAAIEAGALWDRVLADMQHSMPREVFKTYLLGTSAEWLADARSLSEGEPAQLRVRASPASVPWLVHRYQARAERFAADRAGQPVAVAFVARTPTTAAPSDVG